MSQLTSVTVAGGVAPVYVDDIGGACSMFFTGNGQANSPSQPGFLVLAAGTITFNGTVNYYGMIYNANLTNLSGDVVTIHGNANVQGAINVDGSGGIGFGSSKINFVYDSRVFHELKGWGGAAATPNSFRILPIGQ
jgi:hypothetical protein